MHLLAKTCPESIFYPDDSDGLGFFHSRAEVLLLDYPSLVSESVLYFISSAKDSWQRSPTWIQFFRSNPQARPINLVKVNQFFTRQFLLFFSLDFLRASRAPKNKNHRLRLLSRSLENAVSQSHNSVVVLVVIQSNSKTWFHLSGHLAKEFHDLLSSNRMPEPECMNSVKGIPRSISFFSTSEIRHGPLERNSTIYFHPSATRIPEQENMDLCKGISRSNFNFHRVSESRHELMERNSDTWKGIPRSNFIRQDTWARVYELLEKNSTIYFIFQQVGV